MNTLFLVLMFLTALFLILLVLVQRGKGGGLAGAFGGMGGQSAFGTKAGDTFTKITVFVAAFWIILCIFGVRVLRTREDLLELPGGADDGLIPASTSDGVPEGGPAALPDAGSDAAGAGAEAPADNSGNGDE